MELTRRIGTQLDSDQILSNSQFIARIFDAYALPSKREIDAACLITDAYQLPSHHDHYKNWDTLKCLHYILSRCGKTEPILDVGASLRSVILNWLIQFGYEELYACDLREKGACYENSKIKFCAQDLCATNYPDSYFSAITSISVIEHGVPLEKYVVEMSRLLKPGGVLLTSTDYWSEYIDCSGIYPYGADMPEMMVMQKKDILQLCKIAEKYDLRPITPIAFETKEKAISWKRVKRDYTFIFFALEKSK
jgi:SAM-dependent methyltransferase